MLSKIGNVDRRIIYVLLCAVIAIALIKPVGLAIKVSAETKKVYDAIDRLPPGSIVWLGFEFDAGGIPELMPAARAIIRHGFQKDIRFVCGGMWTMAGDMATMAFDAVKKDFPDKQYGVDWVNIGYRPGNTIWLDQMIKDAAAASAGVDSYGNPLADLPLMQEFTGIKDAKMMIIFVTGTPGTPEYIKTVSTPYGIPLAVSTISVEVPGTMPYINSGQVLGGVLGMKGAAEYEVLVNKPGSAVAGMDAQSFAHALIILFIILGNIGYILEKKNSVAK
ncbi:MAG: hypothetical protein IMF26_02510 [Candidatus Fermentithermobacillus carboniphilus]|uniref:Uncharacterized protein n=1 Tax=Candidatus Fermentithermobacillus carboniphilus TaxID=3085328 RepID=A0AAT9LE16_9FIRM|nr:MAG: hypothetical protein IMF26_02510 [Candidatus Fermentithermobacillus carboniphilus]